MIIGSIINITVWTFVGTSILKIPFNAALSCAMIGDLIGVLISLHLQNKKDSDNDQK